MTTQMTIPDEAVQAMPERIYAMPKTDTKHCVVAFDEASLDYHIEYVRADLALPFLTGVKVKALEWTTCTPTATWKDARTVLGIYSVHPCLASNYAGQFVLSFPDNDKSELFPTEEAAKSAAQADYEARIRSAIETVIPVSAPFPRAQALDLSLLERIAKLADDYDHPDENGPFPDIQDAMVTVGDLRKVRETLAALRALSSQPVADGWLSIEKEPDSKQGPFLVTNNPRALNAFGRPSHVWCVSGIYKDNDGSFCAFEGNQKIHGLVMFMPISAHLPSSPGASE